MLSLLRKRLDWSKRVLLIIVAVALIARIMYAIRPAIPWWDETIYIGMAKYLYTGGTLGYWETFRPVVMPFVYGFGWKAGLGIILLTYVLGEKLYKHAGLLASGMMALLPVFFSYGNKLLTSIPATAFALLALFFLMKKRWYWTGFFVGLAFMTRFVMALFAVALAIGIIVPWLTMKKKKMLKKATLDTLFRKSAKLLVGFFTIVIPYLIANLIMYGNAFFPIKEGSRVFTQYNNWLYEGGRLFYTKTVIAQNALLVFCVLGVIAFIRLKMWKSELWTIMLSAMVLPMIYFGVIAHKEARFYIPIFPLIAIFAGVGIAWMLVMSMKKWKAPKGKALLLLLSVITLFSLLTGAFAISFMVPEASLEGDKAKYYNFFENASMDEEYLIASGPLYMVYTDKPFTPLRSWELAEEVWTRYGHKASHVAIDLCDHPCELGSDCETWRADFLKQMNKVRGKKIFDSVYERWDGESCEVFIWELDK